ncbi:MAG: acyl-CoA thioesterase [Bdellovibrionales bacterium]
MVSVFQRRVAFHETDCMGVVHHSVYAKYFEEARVEFLYSNGLNEHHAPNIDFILAVLSLEVKYVKPLKVGDLFEVKMSTSVEGSTRIFFEYQIFLRETLVTEGKTLHVGLNSELKVVKPPRELIKGIKEYGS